MMKTSALVAGLAGLWLAGLTGMAGAADTTPPPATPMPVQQPPTRHYEDEQVKVRLITRTPDQLTAFYIARGFSHAAIEQILDTCFITPVIHNKTLDVLWLELDDWQFTGHDGKPIARLKRDYWPDKWRAVGLPQAHQSTFGWTLLPEVRDLRRDEGAGGSVALPMQTQPFTLKMILPTGADKKGPVKTIVFKDLQCLRNPH